jgi:hypothetical protein
MGLAGAVVANANTNNRIKILKEKSCFISPVRQMQLGDQIPRAPQYRAG